MNTYQAMAQAQGGLTAQQVQGYQHAKALSAQSQASLASASLSIAQSQYARSQTAGQDISNTQASAYGNSKAYQNMLNYGAVTGAPAAAATSTPQNNNSNWLDTAGNWMDNNVNKPHGTFAGDVAHNMGWFGA